MAEEELVITLVKTELVYEVQSKTHLTGVSRFAGDNFEQVANMQMGDDEGHKNQILRSLGDTYRELKTKMSNYVVGNTDRASDIQEEEDGDFKLTLKMPSNFNQAVLDSIAVTCHRFLVSTAVCDWFMITNPNEAKNCSDLAIIALQSIREAVNKKTIPTRAIPSVSV